MRIHYISSYVDFCIVNDYRTAPSASAKISYIKEVLKQSGYVVSMFSLVCSNKWSFSKKIIVDGKEIHRYPFSFGSRNVLVKRLSYLFIYVQLFFYLLFRVKSDDYVLFYHSIPDTKIVKLFNKLLRLNIILEVEELYSAVFFNKTDIPSEVNLIKDFPKGYLLVNSILGPKCNLNKPYIVCEGQYLPLNKQDKKKTDINGNINLLYAGVFEADADVFCAIMIMNFLPLNYILHVAGYGDSAIISKVDKTIASYNNSSKYNRIIYHGCLHGNGYESLLSMCSIGICPRVLDNNLSDYTFPSKIYAYLARNLKVVCTPISCVLRSPIAGDICFSHSTDPKDIAEAVLSIDNVTIDNTNILMRQHQRFVSELSTLINTL